MLYLKIVVLIVVTLVLGRVFRKLNLPEVVGQLLAGLILGVGCLNAVQTVPLIQTISEIGVLILMLNSGLESDLKEMKMFFKSSLLIAILGAIIPFIIFSGLFLGLGYSIRIALFAGVVFSATSVSITLAVLAEQGKLATPLGSIIISSAILDDIIALISVSFFSYFVGDGGFSLDHLLPLMAFVLGLLIRRWQGSIIVAKKSSWLGNCFFYPVFFGSIGLEVSLQSLNDKLVLMALFSIIAVITKFAGSWLGARLSGLDQMMSKAIGAGMVSRGEMALVITQMGISAGIITQTVSTEFIIVILISTMVAPLLMKKWFY